jgi:hypothetical protein
MHLIEYEYSAAHMTVSWITLVFAIIILLAAIYYVVMCVMMNKFAKIGEKIFKKLTDNTPCYAVFMLASVAAAPVILCVLSGIVAAVMVYADVEMTMKYCKLIKLYPEVANKEDDE